MVDIVPFLSCTWPIILGLSLATIIAWGLPIPVLRKMSPTHKWVITFGITLVISIVAFAWYSFLWVQVNVVFASLGSHGRVISQEFNENINEIQQELWLREVIPPIVQVDCFSTNEICSLIETVLVYPVGQSPHSQQRTPRLIERWVSYFMQFLILGLTTGLATGWVQYRLMQQRLKNWVALDSQR